MQMPNYRDNSAPWSDYQADIKEVVIENGVTNIGACAFKDYKNITSVTIPSSVETIEENAFSGCESLTSVDIPNSVKTIGASAFKNCVELAHLTLGKCVETIGRAAFSNCLLPKTLIIPYSVQIIEDDAFFVSKYYTSQLERVIIFVNNNLKIKEYVFEGQDNLSEIMLPGENMVPFIGDIGDMNGHCKLYVPSSLENEYCVTSPWNNFESIEPMLYLTDEVPYTDKENTGLWGCYTRDFKNTEWQALYLPFSLDYEDWKDDFEIAYINGICQYDTEGDDGIIDETWLDIVKIKKGKTRTNYPYMIKAKNTGQAYLIGNNSVTAADISIACSTTTDRYTFTGTYKNVDGPIMEANGYYAMGNGELIQSDGESPLKPYRWYMEITGIKKQYDWNWAKSINIDVIEDEESVATGVVELHAPKNIDNSVYDLNGRKMNEGNLKPGIYVKNGKKIVVE